MATVADVRPAPAGELLSRIDAAPLTARYWAAFGLIMLQLVCEIFDFFVVSFLVSALAPAWKLTFGQSTIMLLSAGVGAIFGALGLGWIADRIGRRNVVVMAGMICGLCAGALAFIPDGDWRLFCLLRFLVGFGYGGAGASQFSLVVEYTPAPRRTLLASSLGVPAGAGLLLASLVVAALFPVLGWRGVAALGFVPALLAIPLGVVAPESPRWLAANGRPEQARRAAAAMLSVPAEDLPEPAPPERPAERPSPLRLLDDLRRFWLVVLIQLGLGTTLSGVLLWGPTILAQLLRVSTRQAAAWFTLVSLAGLAGRIVVTFAAQRFGRVPVGRVTGLIGAVLLAAAAMFHQSLLFGAPAFLLLLTAGHFFYDGAFSNVNTYGAELYPVRLAALGMGLAAACGGLGKMLGPLVLGLMAGSHNLVSPQATERAVTPGFLFLAGACLVVGLAFSFLGIETNRRPLALD